MSRPVLAAVLLLALAGCATSTARHGPAPVATPSAPAAAAAGANGGAVPAEEPPPAEKLSFWDVLRPLTEQGGAEAPAEDEATEQALSEVRRQLSQSNPRRRKTRRS